MNGINWTRVLLGGLVAGVVMNAGEAALHGGLLGAEGQALLAKYQVAPPESAMIPPTTSPIRANTMVIVIHLEWRVGSRLFS